MNIGLNLVLVPRYGTLGAASTTCCTMVMMTALMCYQSTRYLSIRPLNRSHAKLLLNAIIVLAVLLSMKWLLPSHWIVGVFAVSISLAASALLTYRIMPNGSQMLQAITQRLRWARCSHDAPEPHRSGKASGYMIAMIGMQVIRNGAKPTLHVVHSMSTEPVVEKAHRVI